MVTYAVTLSDLIEKGGAYAGLAAFFGLAILSILYFAQAREIRRLRDWAGRAPERAQELEQRVVAQAEAARKTPAAPSRRPGEPATAAAQRTVATPAATPAADQPTTIQKPSEEPDKGAEEAPAPAPAEETRVEAPAPQEEGSPTEHEVVAAKAAPEAVEAKEPVPAGATALAGAPPAAPAATPSNGAPPETPSSLPPRATQSPAVKRPAPAAPLRSPGSVSRRPGAPPPRSPLIPTSSADDNGGRRTGVVLAGIVAGLVVIVVGLIAIIGGGGDSEKPPKTANTSPSAQPTASAPDETAEPKKTPESTTSRADTQVAVLNGTTVSGLAASVNSQLEQAGFTASQPPTNYTDQARSASVVFYNGSANRTQAIEIAQLLDISDRQPIIDAAAQLAPGADVVVVVGADQTP